MALLSSEANLIRGVPHRLYLAHLHQNLGEYVLVQNRLAPGNGSTALEAPRCGP